MGLGRADDHPTVNFGDRFDDLDPAPGQVDPAGGQGHELAPAQAGVGQDSNERVVRRAGLGQRLYLIMSEKRLGVATTRGRGTPSATFRTSRPSRTAAVRAGDRTRWAYRTVAGASPSSESSCTQLDTSEWVIRDRGTRSQRGRIWRRSATRSASSSASAAPEEPAIAVATRLL